MKPKNSTSPARNWLLAVGLLALVLVILFHNSFVPGLIHFSNDGPLGAQAAEFLRFPDGMSGMWDDLNSVGLPVGAYAPTVSIIARWLFGAVGYAKFLAPFALFVLGLGAFTFFRQLRLSLVASTLGAFAAMLNAAFFSAACWGVASQQVAVGMNFLALALIVSNRAETPSLLRWVRYALAGCCVGMSVMEGLDNGAIFSVMIAAFAFYYALTEEGPIGLRALRGFARVAVIAGFAGFIAAHTVIALVSTSVKGIAGTEKPKSEQWDFATQWSLPKREVLGIVVPGFFGYRSDTPAGGNYWGLGGGHPAWQRYFEGGRQGNPPAAGLRHSGGGPYLGVLVALLGAWAVYQSFNRKDSAFSPRERKLAWFWFAAGTIALLLAFGRFAPFYQVVYALPYASTIRNPVKFIAIFEVAAVVLFAYGVNGLWRKYMASATTSGSKGWWTKASAFDKWWVLGSFFLVVASLLGWWGYSHLQTNVEEYITELSRLEALGRNAQFNLDGAQAMAHAQATFSIGQVGWFVLILVLGVGITALILRGTFTGPRAKVGAVLLGLLLVVDLGLVDQNWIIYWNYKQKYDIDPANSAASANPIIEQLRHKSYEGRTVILPNWFPYVIARYFPQSFRVTQDLVNVEQSLDQLYGLEWAQHHFPYYNIQSLDVIQMPRVPADLEAYETGIQFQDTPDTLSRISRRWELTNTRYILGAAPWLPALNGALDPERQRFRIVERFNFALKKSVPKFNNRLDEITAEIDPNGNYALFEYTGALPRAALFSNWQMPVNDPAALNELKSSTLNTNELAFMERIGTNDFLTLKKLASPAFDPHQTVLLASPVPAPPANATNQNATAAEFVSYKPTDIVLRAETAAPSVLLLNDKYDPNWKVLVDNKPAELLRCNFIMRGVYLTAGKHTVEFRFQPAIWALYVTEVALVIALLLIGYVWVATKKTDSAPRPA